MKNISFNKSNRLGYYLMMFVLFTLAACQSGVELPKGDADNGGLTLPGGFEAVVVADSIGRARHLTVRDNGDIYVKLRVANEEGQGIVALRDTDNDGKADIVNVFGDYPENGSYGTGMEIYNGYFYFSTAGDVFRIKIDPEKLVPEGEAELILRDDYKNAEHGFEHIAKPLAFDNEGNMYVPFGSPGDVCQEFNRRPGMAGMFPCPQLEWHGGIWRFDANKLNQTQKDGYRYATGIRSVVAMDWNDKENSLYVVQHGRDNLYRTWPDLYSRWESAVLPSEEFFKVEDGTNGGWPYYYYDHIRDKKLLNPEYGGDKELATGVDSIAMPLMGFPGHYAPNDLFFYTGDQFPERYKDGAFVAFHGSTIRGPYPQAGYFVGFVPFEDGKPSGPWEVFADGFAQLDTIVNTGDAAARPMGISMGPDGSLYVTESVKGKIWRIMYPGDKEDFTADALAELEERKKTRTNIKKPSEEEDNLEKGMLEIGEQTYNVYCATCHQSNGLGDGTRFPTLSQTKWVRGNKKELIKVLLEGLEGQIDVKGVSYNGIMPAHSFLSDAQIAGVLTYIRKSFGNNSSSISAIEVGNVRKEIE
ncbi:c-type cytochrome [Cyclobacterium marinum]|uniref:Cytochrome c class I n=1 Tax=Cyclobacterium marinum (strain ATCC 25205 / DSM 745 / LMG 13164 / NCIMB 1802) TaxID=880070 RepID=G0J140_CYCMS|nr:c-type cytochrome [Cyclobacterium marinum]AEL25789.1 cytochrome c class I [Cyclobacterium marinum DSM 745]MBI0401221.1 PQQ-dependent sugar dehydrogenase [Cyclobacterium marinum]MBR9777259.1 c-type cytochrome [Cytophagales bacterium]|tara:strand:- start:5151 stop:6908 length:1758 start_codon:yes stop_codon:yes gene_type:complete